MIDLSALIKYARQKDAQDQVMSGQIPEIAMKKNVINSVQNDNQNSKDDKDMEEILGIFGLGSEDDKKDQQASGATDEKEQEDQQKNGIINSALGYAKNTANEKYNGALSDISKLTNVNAIEKNINNEFSGNNQQNQQQQTNVKTNPSMDYINMFHGFLNKK